MEDHVLPGDVDTGDLITLPGCSDTLEVQTVRLGQGGFILAVRSAGMPGPAAQRTVTLTAQTPLRRHGRVPAS